MIDLTGRTRHGCHRWTSIVAFLNLLSMGAPLAFAVLILITLKVSPAL
jgi:hypothetical protein